MKAGTVDDALAIALVGTAVFQLASLWQDTAPTLGDLRSSTDLGTKQKLVDADVVVGIVAFTAAIAIAWLTKDATAMIVILATYGLLAWYYHMTLAAPAV